MTSAGPLDWQQVPLVKPQWPPPISGLKAATINSSHGWSARAPSLSRPTRTSCWYTLSGQKGSCSDPLPDP